MTQSNHPQVSEKEKRRPIVGLSDQGAREFLLKTESYLTLDLPAYFQFGDLLKDIATSLDKGPPLAPKKSRDFDHVNHTLLNNKDGKYAWRPIELIHPVLYVSLVNTMTHPDQWEKICDRFRTFQDDPKIQCLSLPVESLTNQTDKAEQIGGWWQEVEQKSIALSLDYEFLIRTDIVDCYASMYTHSIAWAVHTKAEAKQNRWDLKLVGNFIDSHIQNMRQGQTNGIPQGSVLMDFIAEMVLGYADIELLKKVRLQKISDYQILRYRDDYRIFVNNIQAGETILKCLTEVMIDLGLKLNPEKTAISNEVVRSSIKEDKLDWMLRGRRAGGLQKRLLTIHDHGKRHPNSGSVASEMLRYYKHISGISGKGPKDTLQLIGIVADIAYHNPRTYPVSVAILGKLISFLDTTKEKLEVIDKLLKKFSRIPNTGHLEIWLQRISLDFGSGIEFREPLCRLVNGEDSHIWNSEWIVSQDLRQVMDSNKIVDQVQLGAIDAIIPFDEVEVFADIYP